MPVSVRVFKWNLLIPCDHLHTVWLNKWLISANILLIIFSPLCKIAALFGWAEACETWIDIGLFNIYIFLIKCMCHSVLSLRTITLAEWITVWIWRCHWLSVNFVRRSCSPSGWIRTTLAITCHPLPPIYKHLADQDIKLKAVERSRISWQTSPACQLIFINLFNPLSKESSSFFYTICVRILNSHVVQTKHLK